MIDRQSIEIALSELYELLNAASLRESDFQSWFERHPLVFAAYGYRRFIPHPRLEFADGRVLVPDFLAEDLSGRWHVVELKTPTSSVLKAADRRVTFFSEFESYVAQCREYSRFFEDGAQRSTFNTEYGASVQHYVHAVIVAGRRDDAKQPRIHDLLFDRGAKVALETYDDVATRLEFFRAQLFAANENCPGLSVHMVAMLGGSTQTNNFILDFGVELIRNRVSIYVSNDQTLVLRVVDRSEKDASTRVALSAGRLDYNRPTYLCFELGFAMDSTFASVEINGEHFSDRRHDKMVLDPEATRWMVMGSDVCGKEPSDFSMIELAIYNRTLTFDEKRQLRSYFLERHATALGESDVVPSRVVFKGNQFLHTNHHPNFLDRS